MITPTDAITAFVLVTAAIMVGYLGAGLIAALIIRLVPDALLPPHLRAEIAPENTRHADRAAIDKRKAQR